MQKHFPAYQVGQYPATAEQGHIIDLAISAQTAPGGFKIEAGAGSGKTSILRALTKYLKGKGVYIAFNKTIADEAAEVFPSHVKASTAHALAYAAVGRRYKHRLKRLTGSIVSDHLNNETFQDLSEIQMANLALTTLRHFCFSADKKILHHHLPITPAENKRDPIELADLKDAIVLLARQLWREMENINNTIPVSHDFYIKKWALTDPVINADYIFMDEAQDANHVLIDVLAKQQAQVFWVGDSYQSIYAWRGAVNAMATIHTRHNARLTQSFRFGNSVANVANLVLGQYLHSDFQIRGLASIDSKLTEVAVPDALICRTNHVAMREAIALMNQGIKVRFEADTEALSAAITAISELKNRGFTLHEDFASFSSYKELATFAASEEGVDYRVLLKIIGEHGSKNLIAKLDNMAESSQAEVLVITAHKAKGKEFSRVRLAGDFLTPDNERFDEQEGNLLYVAVTRAVDELDLTAIAPLHELCESNGLVMFKGNNPAGADNKEEEDADNAPAWGMPAY